MAGTRHVHGRDTYFTHTRWRIGYNMIWYIAYFEVSDVDDDFMRVPLKRNLIRYEFVGGFRGGFREKQIIGVWLDTVGMSFTTSYEHQLYCKSLTKHNSPQKYSKNQANDQIHMDLSSTQQWHFEISTSCRFSCSIPQHNWILLVLNETMIHSSQKIFATFSL